MRASPPSPDLRLLRQAGETVKKRDISIRITANGREVVSATLKQVIRSFQHYHGTGGRLEIHIETIADVPVQMHLRPLDK